MYYLAIDTSVWLDLVSNFAEVRVKITELVDSGKARIIIPIIVIDEWNRNNQQVIQRQKSSIQGKMKNAKDWSVYLSEDQSTVYKGILDQIQKRHIETELLALKEVEAINYLLSYPSTIKIEITDQVKLKAVDFAIKKKAPFHVKNSMADALILFSCIEYVRQNQIENCIFVSSNHQDFSSKLNRNYIHEDLQDDLSKAQIKYFINIGLAVNEIEENTVSNESINEVEEAIQVEVIQESLKVQVGVLGQLGTLAASEGAIQKLIRNSGIAASEGAIQKLIRDSGIAASEGAIQKLIRDSGIAASEGAIQKLIRDSGIAAQLANTKLGNDVSHDETDESDVGLLSEPDTEQDNQKDRLDDQRA